jgi:murein DD-endopeptidase MepM/ murein hydrolase activator NlpD
LNQLPMNRLPLARLWLTLGTALTLLGGVVNQAEAIEVTVSPKSPRLGDTLSIVVTPDPGEQLATAPTVNVGGKNYSAYQTAPNRWRTLIPTTPLDTPGKRTLTVNGNQQQRNLLVWVANRWFPSQSIWLPPDQDDAGTDLEFDRMDALKATVTPQKFWSGAFRNPNNGPRSTPFGVKRYYNGVFADDYYHRGLDYADYAGGPVYAPANGRVALVGREADGFEIHGNCIGIDHGQGVITVYLHLTRIDVKEGDYVSTGQPIGTVGSTGASTGPHLHWGLYVNGLAVDPDAWINQSFE